MKRTTIVALVAPPAFVGAIAVWALLSGKQRAPVAAETLVQPVVAAPPAAESPEKPKQEFIPLVSAVYRRGFPIGDALSTRLGLDRQSLESLRKEPSFEEFDRWLETADKRLETTSRLRVPSLRSDRPTLDGLDIYDGFFAPRPALWNLAAPEEGSLSRLASQKMLLSAAERAALDRMLKAALRDKDGRWESFPAGSKIYLTAGKCPSAEIWINMGPQLESVDETIAKAKLEKRRFLAIADPEEKAVLNKHFNFSLRAKDDLTRENTGGKFERPIDRLYDVVRRSAYDPSKRF